MARERAQQIEAEAADWAARADRGLTTEEDRSLEAWLAGDVRRIGAYGRMRALAVHTERAAGLGATFDPAQFRTRRRPTRRFVLGGGAIAAGLAASVGIGISLEARGERYGTQRGEVKVVPLGDGSVVTLSTQSTIAVAFSRGRRQVRLLQGEALFDVAKDPKRPFLVTAGDTVVRAVGTSFTVQHLERAPVRVLVREGVVEVARPRASGGARPLRVAANMRAISGESAISVEAAALPANEVGRELAWREGRLSFEGETLQQAASEFARWSDTRIVIVDARLAAEPVTGLFQANDPVGFAQAVSVAFNARATVGEGQVTLSR